jgi:hypothetical protein
MQRIHRKKAFGSRHVLFMAYRRLHVTPFYHRVRPANRVFLNIFNKERRKFEVFTAVTMNTNIL